MFCMISIDFINSQQNNIFLMGLNVKLKLHTKLRARFVSKMGFCRLIADQGNTARKKCSDRGGGRCWGFISPEPSPAFASPAEEFLIHFPSQADPQAHILGGPLEVPLGLRWTDMKQ